MEFNELQQVSVEVVDKYKCLRLQLSLAGIVCVHFKGVVQVHFAVKPYPGVVVVGVFPVHGHDAHRVHELGVSIALNFIGCLAVRCCGAVIASVLNGQGAGLANLAPVISTGRSVHWTQETTVAAVTFNQEIVTEGHSRADGLGATGMNFPYFRAIFIEADFCTHLTVVAGSVDCELITSVDVAFKHQAVVVVTMVIIIDLQECGSGTVITQGELTDLAVAFATVFGSWLVHGAQEATMAAVTFDHKVVAESHAGADGL